MDNWTNPGNSAVRVETKGLGAESVSGEVLVCTNNCKIAGVPDPFSLVDGSL